MSSDLLLLDACVIINLYATDQLEMIARSLDTKFLVVEQAAAEVGQLREMVNGEVIVTPIDLSKHIEQSVVGLVRLDEAEYGLYVSLATTVGDGEAATIAVAQQRNILLATDDRKARRVCASQGLQEPSRTLSLVKAYAEAVSLREAEILETLQKIRNRASFVPPRADPDVDWWNTFMN